MKFDDVDFGKVNKDLGNVMHEAFEKESVFSVGMLEDIRHRLADSEHVYFCASEEETRHMLSLIDKYKGSTQ